MKIKTINYSESIETVREMGLKRWRKLGMEAELDEHDEVEVATEVLKQTVKMNLREEQKISHDGNLPVIDYKKEEQKPASTLTEIIKQMDTCNDIGVLVGTYSIFTKDPQFKIAYDKKKKELQNHD